MPIQDKDNKEIAGEEKNTHLSNLINAVEKAGTVFLKKLDSPEPEVATLCRMITSTLRLLEYYRNDERVFGIPKYSKITIDPEMSGFPNFIWLYGLYGDESILENLKAKYPEKKIIAGDAKKGILRGEKPTDDQDIMARINYYETLENTVLVPHRVTKIKNIYDTGDQSLNERVEGDESLYEITVFGRDRNVSMYTFVRIKIAAKKGEENFEKRLDALVKEITEYAPTRTVQYTFDTINYGAEIARPLTVEKYTVGPFFSLATDTPKEISELFKKVDNPYMLILQKESIKTAQTLVKTESTYFKKQKVTKVEHPEDVKTEQYAVCPFELKEAFENIFKIKNERITIFGITKGGEVYGGTNNNN